MNTTPHPQNAPTQSPAQTPIRPSAQPPTQSPARSPAQTSAQSPAQSPAQTSTRSSAKSPARSRVRRLLTVLGAAVAAVAVWVLAVPVAGTELIVRMGAGTQPVGPVAVVLAGLAAGLAGWALLAVLERVTAKAGRIWTITALAVLALSLTGPLGSATGPAATLVLLSMHLVVGAVVILGLTRR
ncbi:DUF6069 family protein [Nonomuraea fuscirosea]|uniref:DUF6069 family protein n=1 Tax=Nonomuraea fuscirosea TaxID=1291556 RepID=UPI003429ED72